MKFKLIILLIIGTWLGMLLGISFLEAPLKFRAPNITLPLGLGIGKLVFSALNKVEITFSLIFGAWLIYHFKNLTSVVLAVGVLLILIIAIQSIWLIPVLNARADDIIAGLEVASTNHHLYYVILEGLKVFLLFFGFVKIYNHS